MSERHEIVFLSDSDGDSTASMSLREAEGRGVSDPSRNVRTKAFNLENIATNNVQNTKNKWPGSSTLPTFVDGGEGSSGSDSDLEVLFTRTQQNCTNSNSEKLSAFLSDDMYLISESDENAADCEDDGSPIKWRKFSPIGERNAKANHGDRTEEKHKERIKTEPKVTKSEYNSIREDGDVEKAFEEPPSAVYLGNYVSDSNEYVEQKKSGTVDGDLNKNATPAYQSTPLASAEPPQHSNLVTGPCFFANLSCQEHDATPSTSLCDDVTASAPVLGKKSLSLLQPSRGDMKRTNTDFFEQPLQTPISATVSPLFYGDRPHQQSCNTNDEQSITVKTPLSSSSLNTGTGAGKFENEMRSSVSPTISSRSSSSSGFVTASEDLPSTYPCIITPIETRSGSKRSKEALEPKRRARKRPRNGIALSKVYKEDEISDCDDINDTILSLWRFNDTDDE